jgi:hypothetical protein
MQVRKCVIFRHRNAPEANTQLPMKEVDLGTIVSTYEIIQSIFRCETTDVWPLYW